MISELIRKRRDEVYCNTGIMPQYLYLGPQAHKNLLKEAEEYLKPRGDRAFPDLAPLPVPTVPAPPPPDQFMGMIIVEREDWPAMMMVITNKELPECFEPDPAIASENSDEKLPEINPKERRTVH